jgi:hypothetical protein
VWHAQALGNTSSLETECCQALWLTENIVSRLQLSEHYSDEASASGAHACTRKVECPWFANIAGLRWDRSHGMSTLCPGLTMFLSACIGFCLLPPISVFRKTGLG